MKQRCHRAGGLKALVRAFTSDIQSSQSRPSLTHFLTAGEDLFESCSGGSAVPLHKGGKRMVALSFELTNPADQELPASEKVRQYGTNIKIVQSGGVAGGAYATGFALSKSWGPTVSKANGSHSNHAVHASR